jgi:2-polyprenyl-3-methyl-5-hydroxy-6-metoxy-1,4-benzoquinol methylase
MEEAQSVHADLESNDFEDTIQEILDSHGAEKFDVIFSALTIHHLSNPIKTLYQLRKLLKKDGFIILRGSDDGKPEL